jgi:hypothetical protein
MPGYSLFLPFVVTIWILAQNTNKVLIKIHAKKNLFPPLSEKLFFMPSFQLFSKLFSVPTIALSPGKK